MTLPPPMLYASRWHHEGLNRSFANAPIGRSSVSRANAGPPGSIRSTERRNACHYVRCPEVEMHLRIAAQRTRRVGEQCQADVEARGRCVHVGMQHPITTRH